MQHQIHILSDFHFIYTWQLFSLHFLALSFEAGMDAPPRETPRKNGPNRGAPAGQNQGVILESFKFRKATMKQYENNEQWL